MHPENIAQTMYELVLGGDHGGGTVLEVTTAGKGIIPGCSVNPPDALESADLPPDLCLNRRICLALGLT